METTSASGVRRPRVATFLLGLVAGCGLLGLGWWLAGAGQKSVESAPSHAATTPPSDWGSRSAPTDELVPTAESALAHSDAAAPPAESESILRLKAAVAGGDTTARGRLARELVDAEHFYAAWEQAETLLEANADDLDGLYVSAAVRLRMGQPSRALPLLERILVRRPDDVEALVARGRALDRAGHADLAVASWRRAIEAGGDRAEIEGLLASAARGTDGA